MKQHNKSFITDYIIKICPWLKGVFNTVVKKIVNCQKDITITNILSINFFLNNIKKVYLVPETSYLKTKKNDLESDWFDDSFSTTYELLDSIFNIIKYSNQPVLKELFVELNNDLYQCNQYFKYWIPNEEVLFSVYDYCSNISLFLNTHTIPILKIQKTSFLQNYIYNENLINLKFINTIFNFWMLPELIMSIIILYFLVIYIIFLLKQPFLKSSNFLNFNSILIKLCCCLLFTLLNVLYFLIKDNCYIFFCNFLIINVFNTLVKIIITLIFLYILYLIRFWYFQNQKYIIEIYFLLLGCLFFSFILISSTNLILSYIAIEGLSIQIYGLIILNFTTIIIEIVLKYFLFGSLASAIILYGISLLYGLYGSLNYFVLKNCFFKIYLLDLFFNSLLCKVSLFFLFFGLLFKLGLFPLHFWVPSVYTNSPTIIIFFLNTIIKLIFFLFFLNLLFFVFIHLLYSLKLYLIISCLGSMFIGALGSFKELKIKNFISYTSINQIGFLMLGLICYSELSIYYCLYYLFIYIILTIGLLSILFNIQQTFTQKSLIYFSDLKFFYKKNIMFSFIISTYLLSFAGLPPFSGFFGKLHFYFSIAHSKMFLLLFIVMFLNLISLYYYTKILKIIWFENLLVFNLKYIPYRIKSSSPIFFVITFSSIFNIFFLLFIDLYDYFINILFCSMMFNTF